MAMFLSDFALRSAHFVWTCVICNGNHACEQELLVLLKWSIHVCCLEGMVTHTLYGGSHGQTSVSSWFVCCCNETDQRMSRLGSDVLPPVVVLFWAYVPLTALLGKSHIKGKELYGNSTVTGKGVFNPQSAISLSSLYYLPVHYYCDNMGCWLYGRSLANALHLCELYFIQWSLISVPGISSHENTDFRACMMVF